MSTQSLYTISTHTDKNSKTKDGVFAIKKFDEDLNYLETYYLSELPGSSIICSCPAGGRYTCRHRKMLRIFQAENKIDMPFAYGFDKNNWIPMPTAEV